MAILLLDPLWGGGGPERFFRGGGFQRGFCGAWFPEGFFRGELARVLARFFCGAVPVFGGGGGWGGGSILRFEGGGGWVFWKGEEIMGE